MQTAFDSSSKIAPQILSFKFDNERSLDYEKPIKFAIYNEVEGHYKNIYIKNISKLLLTNEPYTKYSGITLGWSYLIFLLGVVLHIALSMYKDSTTKKMHQGTNDQNVWIVMVSNAFASLVFPTLLVHWDMDQQGIKRFQAKNIIQVCVEFHCNLSY